jgi:hypothetical protein
MSGLDGRRIRAHPLSDLPRAATPSPRPLGCCPADQLESPQKIGWRGATRSIIPAGCALRKLAFFSLALAARKNGQLTLRIRSCAARRYSHSAGLFSLTPPRANTILRRRKEVFLNSDPSLASS